MFALPLELENPYLPFLLSLVVNCLYLFGYPNKLVIRLTRNCPPGELAKTS